MLFDCDDNIKMIFCFVLNLFEYHTLILKNAFDLETASVYEVKSMEGAGLKFT